MSKKPVYASASAKIFVRMESEHVAMFRYLLEARENLALFSVLERNPALLKIFFAPQSREEVIKFLEEAARVIPLVYFNSMK